MLLQVGKTYNTRAGDVVKIIRNDNELGYQSNTPFFGYIKNKCGKAVRLAYFSHSGIYNLLKPSSFDIVSEVD